MPPPHPPAELIAAAADITLILDSDGIIRDAAFSGELLNDDECGQWIGRPWIDTVTSESRPKIEEILRGAAEKVRGIQNPGGSIFFRNELSAA